MAVFMSTGRILNIPNILTLARIAFIPVFLVIAYWPPAIGIAEHHGGMMRHLILTAIFVLAAVTDWFDGYLARTLNQTSAFGPKDSKENTVINPISIKPGEGIVG